MIRQVRFRYFSQRSLFAQSLSSLGPTVTPYNDATLWACYRLGLYKTVADNSSCWKGWKGGAAVAASLAATGLRNSAKNTVYSMLSKNKNKVTENQISELARALAPYMPELSLELIEDVSAPDTLRVALLLANKRSFEAVELTKKYSAIKNPSELDLFLTNGSLSSPRQQIDRFNSFLVGYGLSPLDLIDKGLPPSPSNLCAKTSASTNKGPLVSVLMTSYQCEGHIESAIRSLLGQTWKNIELIVIDDASKDGTVGVIERLAKVDNRIICIRLPVNVGTYVAKRIGFEKAKGEFVICHDSDDWSHPEKIERQVKPLINNKTLVFSMAHWVRMQDNGVFYARPVHPLMRQNPASAMFRRNMVYDKAGLWDLVRTGADSEFNSRLKLVFGKEAMARIKLPLTFGAHRSGSLMNAATTGHGERCMSPVRLDYWEAWTRWHIQQLHKGYKPKMNTAYNAPRPFSAPSNICVSQDAINQCISQL